MSKKPLEHQGNKTARTLVPNQKPQQPAPIQQSHPTDALQRVRHAPGAAKPMDILALQRTVGNRAVQRHITPSGKSKAIDTAAEAYSESDAKKAHEKMIFAIIATAGSSKESS
jgi:uncharacterized protein (DUF2267 family)